MIVVIQKKKQQLNLSTNISKLNISSISINNLKSAWDAKIVGFGMGIFATLWFIVWGTLSVTGPQAKWVGLTYSNIIGIESLQGNIYWNNVIFSGGNFSISLDMIMLLFLILFYDFSLTKMLDICDSQILFPKIHIKLKNPLIMKYKIIVKDLLG